jgi:hypothetical protein
MFVPCTEEVQNSQSSVNPFTEEIFAIEAAQSASFEKLLNKNSIVARQIKKREANLQKLAQRATLVIIFRGESAILMSKPGKVRYNGCNPFFLG